MKHAIVYYKTNNKKCRTRFLSTLNMVRKKKATLEQLGFTTEILPRNEFQDNIVKRRIGVNPTIQNRSNYWEFIPFIKKVNGQTITDLICVKNEQTVPLHKAL